MNVLRAEVVDIHNFQLKTWSEGTLVKVILHVPGSPEVLLTLEPATAKAFGSSLMFVAKGMGLEK